MRHFNAIVNFAPCNLRVQKEQIRFPPHPWCNVVLVHFWPIDPSVVGPRFRLTLLTTWRILLKTNAIFLKLKNWQRRPLTLKERNRGLNRVLLITNLIMLLFLMFLILASALMTLSSPFDCSPFSFDKLHFCPDLSSGEEPASFVDRKDSGETTAAISFLQDDQIS